MKPRAELKDSALLLYLLMKSLRAIPFMVETEAPFHDLTETAKQIGNVFEIPQAETRLVILEPVLVMTRETPNGSKQREWYGLRVAEEAKFHHPAIDLVTNEGVICPCCGQGLFQ